MKRIITTVGTSLFTNYMREDVHNTFDAKPEAQYESIKEHFDKLFLQPAAANPESRFERRMKNINTIIKNKWLSGIKRTGREEWQFEMGTANENASAEIKSILAIAKKFPAEEIHVHLLATHTLLSDLAAQMIKGWFDEFCSDPNINVYYESRDDAIKGLQILNSITFEKEGVSNLFNRCEQIYGGDRDNTIINITGGYKALLPFMTIFAQVNGIPIYYIFEDTDELIHIPQAPVQIDLGIFEKYAHNFAELENTVEDSWESYKRRNNIQDDFSDCILELKDDDHYLIGLNPLGLVYWKRYQNFFIAYIPQGSKYFGENPTKKNKLNQIIQDLEHKLSSISEPFETLKDQDLKHVKIKDSYVYKHTNPQCRVQYVLKDKKFVIYNYYFKDGIKKNLDYKKLMRQEYPGLKQQPLTPVTFKKEVANV